MLLYKPELATERQQAVLLKILDPSRHHEIPNLTKLQASWLIQGHATDWRQNPATDKQRQFLLAHDKWRDGMTKGEATELIATVIADFKQPRPEGPVNWISARRELSTLG